MALEFIIRAPQMHGDAGVIGLASSVVVKTIDSLPFCLRRQSLAGEYASSDLPRLADELAAGGARVRYSLQGGALEGRPCLSLRIEADLNLPCQYCGRGTWTAIQSESRVLIAKSEEELTVWETEHILQDALVADARMVVSDLVEDEVLLSLPISPRHPDGDPECVAPDVESC